MQKNLSDPRLLADGCSRATVYKIPKSRGFVGYGDADLSNTSSLVRGAEMRVAETRAVNRALRKAYGIGMCSVEELGSFSGHHLMGCRCRHRIQANTIARTHRITVSPDCVTNFAF